MASSSAAPHPWKYDAFLSFRGKDTRSNFTSHLYDALCRKKIKTFIDDGLERGEEITPALLKTIEESRISVVIFSKNYASSSWCVDELVKILECKQSYGQIVLPIFYHVDPSDVDEQTGCFGNAFAELEKRFKGKMDKVPRWRTELTNAANISGWDSRVTSPESKLVREVVETIRKKLNRASPSELRGLVGIGSRIEQINNLLSISSSDVHAIGIWGMGGIGKTTVAEAFYYSISSQYEGCHFLWNIREESEKGELVRLRDELLSNLLEEKNLHIGTPHIGPIFVKDRICQKKVLLVLDDVTDVRQFQLLIERRDLFGAGSVIVVTSRDRQVLKNVVDEIYEVEELNFREALQLFSLNAFKGNHPPKDYMELSINAINYAKGNPLALQVLGSFLFDEGRRFWESQLNELERIPELNIYDLLRIGFDALHDNNMKSIFLDIACFFKGHQVDFVKRILDGCGFKTEIGFSVLIHRCLIKISNDKVEMHDLLQEMAHEIVQQESIEELGRRSRLWSSKDVYQVLTKNLGTGKVEGIFVDVSKIREMELSSRAFARMYNLRLLKIYNSEAESKCVVHLPEGLQCLSDELRYLHWEEYPSTSLPSGFHAENLVELNLSSSKVEQLWEGSQNLANLKDVNLSNCKSITSMPDLSKAKNLERLILQFCTSLVKVPLCIQHLDKLMDLDLRDCTSLISLPSRINSRCLRTLNLSGCSNLKKCPEVARKMTYLNLNGTAIEELPQSTGDLSELVALNLKNCDRLGNLPENIFMLKSLQIVDIRGCSSISRFPDFSRNIRYLYLNGTAIEELPSSVGGLRELISLDLNGCNQLKNLPSTIYKLGCLEKLDLSGCSSITEFPMVSRNIRELYLDGTAIREIPSSIEFLTELAELHLQNCIEFKILPSSICKLKYMRRLNLSGCLEFENFPEVLEPMERLRYLYLDRTRITKLPSPIRNLMGLSCLEVGNCVRLKGIECFVDLQLPKSNVNLKCLRQLNLDGCCISEVPDGLGSLSSLEVLDLSGNLFQTLPMSVNKLSELQYLGLRNCLMLESLPELPPRLVKLDANNCQVMSRVSSSSTVVEGNIFEFIFTNCWSLHETQQQKILAYSLVKFQLYTKRQDNQVPDIPAGTSSACFPGLVTPRWFSHQSWGSTVTIQLYSHWANSELSGLALCAIIAFSGFKCSLQVKCTYHFRNEHGDCHDLYCHLHGWYDEKSCYSEHMLVGLDPCLIAIKDGLFSQYTEVSIEFQPEDLDGNPLSLNFCQIQECGVRLLFAKEEIQEIRHSDFIWTPFWDLNQVPDIPAGTSSACFPGDETPRWFSHQSCGSTVTIPLPSHWANSELSGFELCAVIGFSFIACSLQVKCTYRFRNNRGDCRDLCCYLYGWYDKKRIHSDHMLVGFDPRLVAVKDNLLSKCTEVSIEFQPEDLDGNLLLPYGFKIKKCGVRVSYAIEEIRPFDFIMLPLWGRHPDLESRFQAKRSNHSSKPRDRVMMSPTVIYCGPWNSEALCLGVVEIIN